MKTSVLLDFDGVIYRNSPLNRTIVTRCNQFVQKHVGIRDPVKCAEINRHLYETHGHTVLGLQRIGYNCNINQFNSFVYSHLNPFEVRNHAKKAMQDATQFREMIQFANAQGIDLYLFSNAPDTWCYNVLDGWDVPKSAVASLSCITCHTLKPEAKCYQYVDSLLYESDVIYFADDKFINLSNVVDQKKWVKVMVTGSKQDRDEQIGKNLWLASSYNFIQQLVSQTTPAHAARVEPRPAYAKNLRQ